MSNHPNSDIKMEELRSVFRLDMEGQEELIAKITAIRKAQEGLQSTMKKDGELVTQSKLGNLEAAKTLEKNKIQVKEYGKEITALSKQLVDQSKANKTQTGSLTEMRLQLKNMTREYDNLSKEQREGTAAGVGMQKSIKALSDELALAEGGTGRMQRKVGSYQEAVDTTNRSIRDMQMELRALRSIPLDNLNPEQIAMTEQNMGRLTDAIGDANARIQVQAMEDIPALVGSLQGVVAASQLVVGTMGLIGVDNERVERLTQSMVQLMGVSQSLAQISELYTSGQAKALALRAKEIILTNAQTVATKAAAAATAIWNKVQKANPIILLAGIIIGVIAGIVALVRNIESVTAVFRRMGEILGIVEKETKNVVATNEELYALTERQIAQNKRKQDSLGFEIRLMKALGLSNDEIIKKERELLVLQDQEAQMAVDNALRQRRKGEITVEAYTEILAAAKATHREIVLFDAEQIRLSRERQEEERKRQQEQTNQRNEAANERSKQEDAERRDRLKRDEQAAMDLAILNAKTEEERLEARIAQIRRNAEIELQEVQLTENERLLIKAEAFNAEMELRNKHAENILATQEKLDNMALEAEAAGRAETARLDQEDRDRKLAQLEFEKELTDMRINIAADLTQMLSSFADDQSQIGQLLRAIQKGIALFEIGVNLQRELSLISVAAAAKNLVLPGSGLIYGKLRTISAIARAGLSAAKVVSMNQGGSVPGVGNTDTVPAMLTPGEGVLRKPAMQSGDYWNLSGTPKQIASTLNQAYGGVEFRNRGGIIGSGEARTAIRQAGGEVQQQILVDAFRNIQIITTVEDINNGLSGEAMRNRLANYFG